VTLSRAGAALFGLSGLLPAGKSTDARLERLARLTASGYWKRPQDEAWGRAATFLFRPLDPHIYAVFPIWRRRYWAVVRVRHADVPPLDIPLGADAVEVVAISVLEHEALLLACAELRA
jgi:hypothetical protein